MTEPRPTLAYSPLTSTVYVLMRNGTKREVPAGEVAAVIAGFLDDNDLTATRADGTRVRYIASTERRLRAEIYDHDVQTLGKGGPIVENGNEHEHRWFWRVVHTSNGRDHGIR